MSSHGVMLRAAALTGVLVGLVSLFFMVVRPWYIGWGATAGERVCTLPGDALVPGAPEQETRAITVQAPAERVWPWVTQLGQDRGGFYSYEILEDLVGCEMENLHHLDPTLQHWQVGDKLWMYPPHKLGGIGHATLAILEPGRTLVFATRQIGTPLSAPPDGTWAFVIEPIDTSASRLLVRGRAAGGLSLFGTAFDWAIFEPAHFAMERKMLESIKAHAEGQTVSDTADTVQVLLWCLTFVAFVTSAVLVLMGRQWRRRLLTFVIAGLLFQLLTLVQPALLVGVPCVAAILLGVWAPRRLLARRPPSDMDARAQSMLRRRQRPPEPRSALHMLVLHTLGTWLLVTIAMIVNGAFRVTILQPWLGERVADIVSAGLGISLILLLTRPFLRRLEAPTHRKLLAISGAWLALTVAFEFLFGHYVMGESWAALLANYNILRGRLWPLILVSLVLAPFCWVKPSSARR
jgi:hypothetical protein